MNQPFKAVQVTDRVYWVGAIDWDLRNFHGYQTGRGTTYNAYLVMADKITLIDTVKAHFKKEMLGRIASVVDPRQIEYIVSNHSEMDHSGCLPEVIEAVQPAKVFVSPAGAKALGRYFGLSDLTVVKSGETCDLGQAKLIFQETKMLHWPDSMFSYLPEEQLLFSQDAFGMHLASNERFLDQIDPFVWRYEAAKYFANILMPFSPLILALAKKLGELQWPIKIIAPDHGPIWRMNPGRAVELYGQWSTRKPTRKAIVVYDTMWSSTARMARTVADGLFDHGSPVTVMNLSVTHRSDVVAELLEAGALVVGSPTMNNMVFPSVADLLTYLRGLKPANLIGAAFGSYGWSGEAVKQIEQYLLEMKVELAAESVKANYAPDSGELEQCYALGAKVAEKLGAN